MFSVRGTPAACKAPLHCHCMPGCMASWMAGTMATHPTAVLLCRPCVKVCKTPHRLWTAAGDDLRVPHSLAPLIHQVEFCKLIAFVVFAGIVFQHYLTGQACVHFLTGIPLSTQWRHRVPLQQASCLKQPADEVLEVCFWCSHVSPWDSCAAKTACCMPPLCASLQDSTVCRCHARMFMPL
jgi:hypothetical protein